MSTISQGWWQLIPSWFKILEKTLTRRAALLHYKELTSLHHTRATRVINQPPRPRSFNSLNIRINLKYGKCRSEKKIWFMLCCSKWSNSTKNFFSLWGGIYKLSFLHWLNPFETLHKYAIDTYVSIVIILHRYLKITW